MSARLFCRVRSCLVLPILFGLTACGGETSIIQNLDPASGQRLAGISEDMGVVISCQMEKLPEKESLDEGVREMARAQTSILIEVPRGDIETLSGFGDAGKVTIWGDARNVNKIGVRLQSAVLEAWDNDPYQELSMLARFKPGTNNVGELLTSAGVKPRTVAGIVATISADAAGIFQVIQLEELETLSPSQELRPN